MDASELIEALRRAEAEGRDLRRGGRRFTSLDRVVWPKPGYTKGDLVRYYVRVADVLLRYLQDRPLMLKRYHGTFEERPVFQQRPPARLPKRVRTAALPSAEAGEQARLIGSRETLYWAAQMNAIELHPWLSRVGSPDRPDWVVLDLDPSPGAGFRKVVRVARALRERLRDAGLDAFVKTSGSRGLHLYVPTGRTVDYERAAELARRLAERVAADEPALATVERSLDERGYRVYIDHLQNARGKTAVAPYSVRARPGAPVSAPVRWDEVDDDLDPRAFTIRDVPARLERDGDLWDGIFRAAGDIDAAIEKLEDAS